jgi:4-hydroxy-3-methylbut-2-en-1-yl diphosphate reductase
MKKFDIPDRFRSNALSSLKHAPKLVDGKRNLEPFRFSLGELTVSLPRHFGFCYGVEHAVELAYQTLRDYPGRRLFFLSEMIHNPLVNRDLISNGFQFLQSTTGETLIPFEELQNNDVVLIPAFGAPLDTLDRLNQLGVTLKTIDTTCPFVEAVWKKSTKLGQEGYTTIIHGKHYHEETKATFSRACTNGPAVVVLNLAEAQKLVDYAKDSSNIENFYREFEGKFSPGFNPQVHLRHIGVVNQTTMLASETLEISSFFKAYIVQHTTEGRFAETRDTLCYATHDNQSAWQRCLEQPADFALVVGGFNSSNTKQLVTLAAQKLPVYFISGAADLSENGTLNHYDINTDSFLTSQLPPNLVHRTILLTGGASCPDKELERVLMRLEFIYTSNKRESH